MIPRIVGLTLAFVSAFVLAFVLESAPAMASRQSIYCATRQPGNPFSRYCNPTAWREWRRRGSGWDSRLDNACRRNPQYIPRGCPRGTHAEINQMEPRQAAAWHRPVSFDFELR